MVVDLGLAKVKRGYWLATEWECKQNADQRAGRTRIQGPFSLVGGASKQPESHREVPQNLALTFAPPQKKTPRLNLCPFHPGAQACSWAVGGRRLPRTYVHSPRPRGGQGTGTKIPWFWEPQPLYFCPRPPTPRALPVSTSVPSTPLRKRVFGPRSAKQAVFLHPQERYLAQTLHEYPRLVLLSGLRLQTLADSL